MGFAGLALGTSIAAIVNAAVQVVMLRRELGRHSRRANRHHVREDAMAVAAPWPPPRGWRKRGCASCCRAARSPMQARPRRAASIAVGLGVLSARRVMLLGCTSSKRLARLVLRTLAAGCDVEAVRTAFDGLGDGVDALRRRRLRQHVRAAAAAADPAARPVAQDGRRAGDVLPARQLGLAARLRHARRPLAAARAADGRAGALGAGAERDRHIDVSVRCSRRCC